MDTFLEHSTTTTEHRSLQKQRDLVKTTMHDSDLISSAREFGLSRQQAQQAIVSGGSRTTLENGDVVVTKIGSHVLSHEYDSTQTETDKRMRTLEIAIYS